MSRLLLCTMLMSALVNDVYAEGSAYAVTTTKEAARSAAAEAARNDGFYLAPELAAAAAAEPLKNSRRLKPEPGRVSREVSFMVILPK